ncbi:hypothetical protein [Dyella sp. 2HG41-7]|uniref:hypothetical protein n=1 Tax=Dyella sp. 2HG41-7 TaxID=2883239 RepID=UPI001F3FD25A|nr:hypothetical protein [Dyella sp. 2HG41-7]
MLGSEEENTGNSPIRTWVINIALIAGFIAICYDKAHPHFFERLLGKSGIDMLGIGFCGYLVFTAISGVRNGAISGTTVTQWKRSENAPVFWMCVAFNGGMGSILGVGLIGDLLGLW